MAALVEQAVRLARSVEQELLTKLADRNAPSAEIAGLIQEYRVACEKIIFSDFQYATNRGIETQLWAAHTKISNNYRKQLSHLRRNGKNRVVELRKLAKHYLEFIKSSQRFYRQYILHLDARFEGIPELRQVTQTWKHDARSEPSQQPLSAKLKHQILLSCHQTLIQLGDLSRYRETELGEKERNWGPAIGYYGLATEIYPDSGVSHNQQAVIAREDGNHFRTTYHLYRSLSTQERYPLAKQNLELEFKKIVSAWEKGELINNRSARDGNSAGRALVAWFVRLHSKCYKGEDFAEHDELENEVLSQLAIELKERSLDGMLYKIILINLAAEYFATIQMQEPEPPQDILRSYFYFLRLNVKTFFTLLQILQPELERLTEGDDVTARNGERPQQLSDKITAVARRILPGLRLYSTWFTRYWHVLNANVADTLTEVEVQELWKAYAESLTLLASAFPAESLPQDGYMLEEDVDTIGFQPLLSDETKKNWYVNGALKRRWSDPGFERHHPNIEMLMRIRDLLVDGLTLTQDPKAPLDLDGLRFIYREAGLPSELLASPYNKPDGSPTLAVENVDMPLFPPGAPLADDQKSYSVAPSESASTTLAKDADMNRMVDDLVGPNDGLDPLPEEDENIPPTPPEQTFEDTALVNDTSYGIGPLTASDFANAVHNYTQQMCSPQTPLYTAMNRVSSSSSIRQLPSLPSLPAQQYNDNGIWNRNYGSPGPSSPFLGNGLGARSSPYHGAETSGHSRGNSANSIRSSSAFADSWTGHTVTPIGPSHDSTQTFANGFGNSVSWGNPNHVVYGNNQGTNRSNVDVGMMSPFLFGNSKSTWSSDLERGTSSYGRTPPNGQGG